MRSPSLRRFAAALTLAALAVSTLTPSALAWGRIGHRVSAKVADARLSPAARAAVADLLEPGETLAEASLWADIVRPDRKETAPWHYVNVPFTEAKYDAKYCPKEGCVVEAIGRMKATLKDSSASKVQKREALRFLAHFVQDMHQPLHVGHRDDKGGNLTQVRWFDSGSNLHRVWDSGIIEQFSDDEAAWLRDVNALVTPESAAKWSQGTVEDWATESLGYAKTAYLDGKIKSGDKLGQDYEDMALPIVRQRMAQAGVRLAMILNEIYP